MQTKLSISLSVFTILFLANRGSCENIVGYKEVCKPTSEIGPHCNADIGFHCFDDGFCDCKYSSEQILIFVEEKEGCVPTAISSDGWKCTYHEQCNQSSLGNSSGCLKDFHEDKGKCKCLNGDSKPALDPVNNKCNGSDSDQARSLPLADNFGCSAHSQCTGSQLGKYSRCNQRTKTCDCYDTEGLNRNARPVEGTCLIDKEIGHSCKTDVECRTTIAGAVICLGSGGGKLGVCSCADKHQFEPNFKECLKLGTQYSPCKTDFQCNRVEALGSLSRCTPAGVCDCWDAVINTRFHEGRCHISRKFHETCQDKLECQLGYHKNAVCLVHESYNGEKVCQCPTGANCKNSGTAPNASISITFGGLCSFILYYVFNYFKAETLK